MAAENRFPDDFPFPLDAINNNVKTLNEKFCREGIDKSNFKCYLINYTSIRINIE